MGAFKKFWAMGVDKRSKYGQRVKFKETGRNRETVRKRLLANKNVQRRFKLIQLRARR